MLFVDFIWKKLGLIQNGLFLLMNFLVLLTGGTIVAALNLIKERGISSNQIKVVSILIHNLVAGFQKLYMIRNHIVFAEVEETLKGATRLVDSLKLRDD